MMQTPKRTEFVAWDLFHKNDLVTKIKKQTTYM